MNYTIYHLHSDYSNATTTMDSVTKIDMYVDKAKKLGMKALAFSEHGNVLEWTKKKRYIEEAGMKYIHAVEPYVTAGLEEKVRDNYHVILIAKNKAGAREINYLMSDKVASNRDDGHFYYVPRITLDELINTSDNVIITTACLGGILYKGDMDIQRKFLKFAIENKHRVFLEIQHHATSEQIEYNQKLYAISQKTGLRLVAGTDTHSLDERYAKGRLLLQRAKGIRFPSEETLDLTFKSYDELVQAYKEQGTLPMSVILEAIENTNVIADMVEEFELDKSHKYPKLHKNSEEVFYQKIMEGIKARGVKCSPKIKKRIIHEASVYKKLGVIDYILLEEEIKRYCRENCIAYGPGRGSVTGSYIAYLLQVTQVDSIKNELIFERFLNPERQTLADVDTDYTRLDRERVKDYLFNREGLYCANIITFGRMGDKSGIRDITRALDMTIGETEEILDKLEFDPLGKMIPGSSINERVAKEYPEIFGYLDLLKGVILNTSTHAGGVLVSPFPLEDLLGTYIPKAGQRPVAQIDMEEIEGLGFVKLDILGVDNIGAIKMACDLIGVPVPTPDELNTNDKAVWDSMRDSTAMIFQWESDTAEAYYRRLFSEDTLSKIHKDNPEISYLDLFSVGNGAIRPAGASYRENLAKGIFKDNGHEALNKLMSKTNGYCIYQEQIIDFLHRFCGFSLGEADIVRRAFTGGGDTSQFTPKIEAGFVKTMEEKYDTDRQTALEILDSFMKVIIDASNYLFSENHSVAYSYIGYTCAWLRYYYPLEFITASFEMFKGKDEKTAEIYRYMRDYTDIKMKPIQFRYSRSQYNMDKATNTIYKGMDSVKYLNEQVSEELYALRDKEYEDFIDLLVDIRENTSCNSRQIKILISLDYFKEFGGINYLLKIFDEFEDGKNKYKKTYVEKTKTKRIEALKSMLSEIEAPPTTIIDIITNEKEYLGYVEFRDESISKDVAVVLDGNLNRYGAGFFTLYHPHDTKTVKVKVRAARLNQNPIGQYDVIQITSFKEEFKKGSKTEKENILHGYKAVKI